MFTSSQLVAFVKAMIGMPYWYGTCGYKCTEDLLQRKAKQYPSHYGASRMKKYRQAIADKKVCVDCIGILKAYFWTDGGQGILDYINGTGDFKSTYASNGMPDKSANGFFSWLKKKGCKHGKIASIPDVPGLAVFMEGHVGVYIGGGYVVEARGFNYGVVKTRLKDRKWVDWSYLPESLITYDDEPKKEESKLITRNLKRGLKGDDVAELQEKLNKLGFNCGEVDGDFGKKTEAAVKALQTAANIEVDGIFGKNSLKALNSMLNK